MTTILPAPLDPSLDAGAPYVMGRTDAEHERLRAQSAKLEPFTAALLDRTGLGAGMRCLDVGCGPCTVMRLMAERVGPDGRVLGIDLDGPLGRQGVKALHLAGHAQCRFVEGDLLDLPRPRGGLFDLAYARLVLIHSADPLVLLRRMWDWTAPGGTLAIQDYDLRTMAGEPGSPLISEFRRVVLGVFDRAGRPVDAGVRLSRWFAAAGIGTPDGVLADGLVEPLGQARGMLEGVYRSVLPLALGYGITSAAEADGWLAALADAPADQSVLYPLLIGAWRRKPR